MQGALISIEPETGDVVAMVGGYSFQESQFNRATQAFRQPGSSFKPIVYSAALDNGFTAASVILDAPVVQFLESGDVWRPSNYEKNFKGPLLLRTARPCPATCALSAWCSRWGSRKSLSGPRIWSWSRISPKCCRSASVRSRLRR